MILVDTNVISEPTRKEPSRAVLSWLTQHPTVQLSAASVLELEAGVRSTRSASKRERLAAWMESLLTSGAVLVVPVDEAVARVAGRLLADRTRRPPPLIDLLIAATAISRGAVLATRNVADFEGYGVPLVNPWRA